MSNEVLAIVLVLGGLIIIPLRAYLDFKIVKLHTYKQFFGICTWEYSIFLIGLVAGVLI